MRWIATNSTVWSWEISAMFFWYLSGTVMNECQNFKTEYIQLYCLNLNDKKICTGYLPNCHKFSTWEKSHLQEMNPHQPFFMGVHSCFKLMFWNSWQSWVNHKLRILFKWLIESYMFAYTVFACCHLIELGAAALCLFLSHFSDVLWSADSNIDVTVPHANT